ncbi:MAG TPA: dihydrofolate reductase family protein [Nocardioides sp.]|jgi:dihydrofolate reductase
MRKLIVSNLISLDGYAAGPGGNMMVLPLDESFSARNVELLREAGTLLLGASTYRGFSEYWPQVAADPDQPPVEHEIAEINGRLDKVVVSDTLAPEEIGAWRESTEIVRRADAHARIAELKEQDGGDIVMFGSITLAHDLVNAGLVDEVHLMVGAGVLGDGVAALPPLAPGTLTLIEARQLEGSSNVLMRYAVSQ